MRGIILAGGTGSRLKPMTCVTNKHLLGIYSQPMIYYPIEYLKNAGVTNIMLITGKEHCGSMIGLLGDGTDLGVELTYRVQSNPDGIAGALKLCKDWAQGENVVVVLGDNLLENGIKPIIDTYKSQGEKGGMIAVIEVPDPHRFGVATLDSTGKVVNLVEKPKEPESNLAVIGVYIYDSNVWSIIPTLKPSARGEYEITDVNRAYMNKGNLYCTRVTGWWTDAGTIESLYDATILMRNLKKGVK